VLNTGYPEVRRLMDTDALDLRYFSRAMLLHVRGSVVRLADPRREPLAALAAIRAPIGSLRDKAALAGYAAAVGFVPSSVLLGQRDRAAEQAWRRYGMTPRVIDRVLRPFLRRAAARPPGWWLVEPSSWRPMPPRQPPCSQV